MLPSQSPQAPARPDTIFVVGTITPALDEALLACASAAGCSLRSMGLSALDRGATRDTMPALVVLSVDGHEGAMRDALVALKRDAQLQTVPTVIAVARRSAAVWLADGADDVVSPDSEVAEVAARFGAALRRSRRDIQVNPSTRLPGADAIGDAIQFRLAGQRQFAACYADLDHFKEFNDRYGFAAGDAVIRALAGVLVDEVELAAGGDGFVGHIGGDDFLFLVPTAAVGSSCDAIIRRADELLPRRYTAHDRQAGYFFGKDRRGRLDRVPLMTLSIGVVTNTRRRFTSAAQVSELATEMKTYCKAIPGSVWAMDRRSDGESATPPEEKLQ